MQVIIVRSEQTLTPDELSLIKARYFRSILAGARSYDDASASRLMLSLANDIPTPNVDPELAAAERAAIDAARRISDGLVARERNATLAWDSATRAVQKWISLFSAETSNLDQPLIEDKE